MKRIVTYVHQPKRSPRRKKAQPAAIAASGQPVITTLLFAITAAPNMTVPVSASPGASTGATAYKKG